MASPTTAGSGDPFPEKWIIGGAFATYWPPKPHRPPLSARPAPHERVERAKRRTGTPALPVRPRARRPLRRRRRRGRPRLPRRPAGRRRGAVRLRGARRCASVRALTRAQRLQAARRRGARGAVPASCCAPRCKVAVVSRCVRGIDERGLHKTNLAALRDALRGVARPGMHLPDRRLPGAGLRLRAARRRRRRRHERRDRRRLDRRQGHARPLHAPRRRAAPRLGVRRPRRLLHARAPRRRSSATASRRCTGCRSSRWPTSSSRCSARAAHQNAALEVVEADQPAARRRSTTPIASKRSSVDARAVRAPRRGTPRPSAAPARACARASASHGPRPRRSRGAS